jgi:hypothetical protein
MMKWAIAEKCTLDDVLDAVTGNRVLFALVEEDRNYRLVRADRWENTPLAPTAKSSH